MFYILVLSLLTFMLLPSVKCKSSIFHDFYFKGLAFLILSIIPSLQYNVGTDYFNYVHIFNHSVAQEYYFNKYEYGFYYIVKILNYLNLSSQSLFVFIGLLQTFLFINFARIFTYNLRYEHFLVFVFAFFISTNVFHNQLNVLRAFVAVLFFINSFAYKIKGQLFFSLLCLLFGVIWHKSILFCIPLLLLNYSISCFVIRHKWIVFIGGLFFFGSGFLMFFLDGIVAFLAPMYKHYLNSSHVKNISLINILTKLYYYPLYFLFLYFLHFYDLSKLRKVDVSIIALWLIVINSALFVFYFGRFSRIFYFFTPFLFVPLYYLFFMKKYRYFLLATIYVLFGYCLKVIVFPQAEFTYNSILF